MRAVRDPQTHFSYHAITPATQKQWKIVSQILDDNPSFAKQVWDDLCRGKDGGLKKDVGAKGMTADQILRFALVKMTEELSWRGLAERVDDSIVLRAFCRIPFGKIPRFTTLQENIKRVRPQTLQSINDELMGYALREGVESAQRVRLDSTATETNIHHPTDARQLADAIRVLTRILHRAQNEIVVLQGRFHDHTRVTKRLLHKINNVPGQDRRKPLYKRLLHVAQTVLGYARHAIERLAPEQGPGFEDLRIALEVRADLQHFANLTGQIVDQTQRRVLRGESVPAQEKIVSLFEPHTDIIVKGQRDVVFGHKLFLAGGQSNLILDCVVEKGNPADAEMFPVLLDRHIERFGDSPRDLAADGGFASKANGHAAKTKGVDNVVFSTPKGLPIAQLAQSERLYKRLRKWRAGIEAVISVGKRTYGLARCPWRGFESFKAYIHWGVLAYNLHTLARRLTA
jgi:IS5 family transposase